MVSDGDDRPASSKEMKVGGPIRRAPRTHTTTLVTQFAADDKRTTLSDLQAIITVLSGAAAGTVYYLEADETLLGRDEESEIIINDPGLSRTHIRFVRNGPRVQIEDLDSTNGTLVNGTRLETPHLLATGDRIQIGQRTVLRFSLQDRLEQEATRRVYEMSIRDGLTHLHNRRYLDDHLVSEFAYAIRHQSHLCVLMIDVDHFKHVNDTFGHAVGDQVLCAVARGLEHIVRTEDLVARYGGEEFVILARGIDISGALAFAERVRSYFAAMEIPLASGKLSITASFGVAHTQAYGYPSVDALLASADEALYRAKRNGRNRVELAEAPYDAPPVVPSNPAEKRRSDPSSIGPPY